MPLRTCQTNDNNIQCNSKNSILPQTMEISTDQNVTQTRQRPTPNCILQTNITASSIFQNTGKNNILPDKNNNRDKKTNTGTPIWIQKQTLHDRANAQAYQRNNNSTRNQGILHSPLYGHRESI